MTKEVYFAAPGDKKYKDQAAHTLLFSTEVSLDLSFFTHLPLPWVNVGVNQELSECQPHQQSAPAATVKHFSIPTWHHTHTHTHIHHHQFWVTVISPNGRADPDAGSHPTRLVTCFKTAQDAF